MGVNRYDFFKKLGIVKVGPQIDGLTHQAYVDSEMEVWKQDLESAPHGNPWHTSFHASSFPGGEKGCSRYQIYTLLNIPSAEPAPPMLRATGEMGKAAENQILYRWGKAGYLIAGVAPARDGEAGDQQKFEDVTWLSGSIDAILGIPGHPYVLPVDIKSKSKEVIDQMKVGAKDYDPKHYAQVQAYIYLCNMFYATMDWEEKGFQRPVGAIIYYVSRENPRHTHEFYVEKDDEFIKKGLENLMLARDGFTADILPLRPEGWKWTDEPCKWCQFKKFACKPDHVAKITKISESKSLEFARTIRPTYDFEQTVKEVLSRWDKTTQ